MKLLLLSVILSIGSFHAVRALQCMQGIEVVSGNANRDKEKENPLKITECGALSAVSSTGLLFAFKPSSISLPSGNYKCYHLKIEDSERGDASIVKGCIYQSINVCDGKFSADKYRESFCSQCDQDGCNGAGLSRIDLKLLGVTLFAAVAYLLQ